MPGFFRCLLLSLACVAAFGPTPGVSETLEALAPVDRVDRVDPVDHAGRVFEWQETVEIDAPGLAKYPHGFNERSWRVGTYYTAVAKLFLETQEPRYHDALLAWAKGNRWKPGARDFHADDQSVFLPYIDAWGFRQNAEELAPTLHAAEATVAHARRTGEWVWHWADALYMAAPGYAALGRITGNDAYLAFLDEQFGIAIERLYNPEQRLFYRDNRYIGLRDEDGVAVFWGRGNGWVFAALASMLNELPEDWESRARYERIFVEMAGRLVELQQPDGFWKSSLLNPDRFPRGESSATGFFCYGLAWGVNQGLLTDDRHRASALAAWDALVGAVNHNGRLGFVQPGGDNPYNPRANQHEWYGSAAFLMAAVEMQKLVDAE